MTEAPEPTDTGDKADVAIVGGGLSGLVTAYWLTVLAPELRVSVLEKSSFPGGKVQSSHVDGFTVDSGPGSLTVGPPETAALVDHLGLESSLVVTPRARRRFIVMQGRLIPLPTGPVGVLATPLLSLKGKVRALAEASVVRAHHGDESIHDFLSRRFGKEAATAFGQAIVSGVAAGDPRQLSVGALFPQLHRFERRHGSVIRAMMASRRSNEPTRRTVGLSGGMGRLTRALVEALGDRVVTSAAVTAVDAVKSGYQVSFGHGRALRAPQVVFATPAYVTAGLLEPMAPEAASGLGAIPYVPVGVVALGYDAADVPRPLDGFGFLAPRGQGVRSLGVINATVSSPGAAPPGAVLFRAIAGGALDPEFASLPREAQVEAVRQDLALTMGVTAKPRMQTEFFWDHAIPQYLVGHERRIAHIEEQVTRLPGLHLVGNAYRGVGVTDCLREGKRLAGSIATEASRAFGSGIDRPLR